MLLEEQRHCLGKCCNTHKEAWWWWRSRCMRGGGAEACVVEEQMHAAVCLAVCVADACSSVS